MRAEIITIGDEILIGQIVDTNSAWMAQHLHEEGIDLVQISSVSDTSEGIREGLALASSRADLILCTGGLGPTKDDVTKQTLVAYFQTGLYRDEAVLRHVTAIFQKFNRPMLEVNKQQADVLENARVLHNETGTAPGMWVEDEGKIYVFMPGVPSEMKYLMEQEVLPRLRKLPASIQLLHRTLLTAGIGESFLAEQLSGFEEALPVDLHLAYLPKFAQVRLRLSGRGTEKERLEQQMETHWQQLLQVVKPYLVTEGDLSLEQVILDGIQQQGKSLSTAESCTGGYLSHLITSLPGSSAVFKGGVVSYSNELKQQVLGVNQESLIQYGAVSEEVALEMALGAQRQFQSDYSVAVTGIAGPDGGSDQKPVGTVWIAVAGSRGARAKLFQFGKVRLPNIERAAANALVMLFQLLNEEMEGN